jgi:hypothetical protein
MQSNEFRHRDAVDRVKAWRIRTLTLGAATFALVGLAACGTQDNNPGQSTTPTATVRSTATRTPTTPAGATTTVGAASTPANTPTPRPARTPTALPTPAPIIGDAVEIPGWRITVTAVEMYGRVGDYTAQGTYTYVRLTVTNTGDTPAVFPYDGLVITDTADQSYFADLNATRETLTFDIGIELDQQIAPGDTSSTAVVFDVPDSVTGLILTTPSRAFAVQLIYPDQPK